LSFSPFIDPGFYILLFLCDVAASIWIPFHLWPWKILSYLPILQIGQIAGQIEWFWILVGNDLWGVNAIVFVAYDHTDQSFM